MKSYNEMAESVLQRAKIRAAQQKHQCRVAAGLIAVTLCVAILITVVGVGLDWNSADSTTPTISIKNPPTVHDTQPGTSGLTKEDVIAQPGKVYFLTTTEEGVDLALMQANITLPMKSMFRVRSLKGLTNSEIDKAVYEETLFRDVFREKYKNTDGGCFEWLQSNDVIIQNLSGGKHSLILPDASQIESVDRETTGVLGVGESWGIYNKDVTIGEGENAVTIPEGSYRILLFVRMSRETQKIFETDPDTPLSTISDTITITINYKNGTKEIVRINVTVDDEGNIYMTQCGKNASV